MKEYSLKKEDINDIALGVGEGVRWRLLLTKMHRRHLNDSQRGLVASKLANLNWGQRESPIGDSVTRKQASGMLRVRISQRYGWVRWRVLRGGAMTCTTRGAPCGTSSTKWIGQCMICRKKDSEFKWNILEVCSKCFKRLRFKDQYNKRSTRHTHGDKDS